MSCTLITYPSCSNCDLLLSVSMLSGYASAKAHWELADTCAPEHRMGHRILAVLEFIPVLGALIALVEMIAGCIFKQQPNSPLEMRPLDGEDLYKFRTRVFEDTQKICKEGYTNRHGDHVKIDHDPMLSGTETYDQPDELDEAEKPFKTRFSVITEDTFQVLRQRKAEGANPVGINMANRFVPGGGVKSGCPAQEEALCRSSNHLMGLETQKYPFPEEGGIYTPHVQIFRDNHDNGYALLDAPADVALVAAAAYDLRNGSRDRTTLGLPLAGDLNAETLEASDAYMTGTANKIRNMLRMMARKGHTHIVLGALGCGAFQNPPTLVARIFQDIFNEDEFKGRFAQVDFAILKIFKNDQSNVNAFEAVCEDLQKQNKDLSF